MCAEPKKNEETIYHEAVSKSPKERKAYIKTACGDDTELLARIEALLKAREVEDSFLEPPALDPNVTLEESPLAEKPGTVIGRYKLLEKVGEGGFGVVYMAEQTRPINRRVALKIIKLGMDTKSVVARFEAERQALAMMEHPNIAKVFDAGATDTGRPYFVMELVKGIPITEYCDKNNLDTRQRLELFVDVCKAVQHAHQKGIIHRDIKPSNVLITLHDGKPVPKVIDFGIAKATNQRLTEKTLFTRFAQMIGTPEYMSPEQAEFSGLDIDTRSDIYSLGVLLYELLTGTTPFDAKILREAGYNEMQRIICEEEPDRPSTKLSTLGEALTDIARHRRAAPDSLTKLIRGDLDWVVMKALEKDRIRRYETASGLAEDIERHLRHEPLVARPPGTAYRLQKFVRRNKMMVTAVGMVALALVLGIIASTWLAFREKQQRERAEANEQIALQAQAEEARQRRAAEQATRKAEAEELLARRQAYAADMRAAQIALDQGDRGQGLDLLRLHVPQPGEPDLRGIEWRYLWQKAQGHHVQVLNQEAMVMGLALGPGGTVVSTGLNGQTRIWDGPSGRMISELPGPSISAGNHQANALAPGLNLLARPTTNGVAVERLPGLETVTVLPEASWPMEFSHDGRWLATRGTNDQLHLWETGRWESRPIATDARRDFSTLTFRFSPDDQDLVWCDRRSSEVKVRGLSPGGKERQLPGLVQMASLAVSPDGRWIAVGNWFGEVRILEYATGAVVTNWSPHLHFVFALAFSPDSRLLATGGNDQVVRLWEVGTWRLVSTLTGNESEIWDIIFAADGQTLWTACKDGTVRQFPVRAPRSLERPFILPTKSVVSAISARGDRVLVVLKTDDTFVVSELDTITLASKPLVSVPAGEVSRVAYWPQVLAVALTNGEAILVCIDETPAVARFQLPSPTARLLAQSPDGRKLLLQDLKGTQSVGPIFTWDINTGRTETELGVAPACNRAAYSPDGRYVATQSWPSSEVVVWDLAERRQRSVLRGHLWYVYCISFSPDGRLVATGSWDGTARLWEAATGQQVTVLKGHRSGIYRVQFSTDGRTLVTLGGDGARFWNVATGRETLLLAGIFQDLVGYYVGDVPQLSFDDRALLFGPFVSEPGESGAPEPGWRYVVTSIPTFAEIDSTP